MADKRKYEDPKVEIINEKPSVVDITPSHGNTRLPFGLCMRYGIPIGDDWTPRDAWDALKDKKGITPDQVYQDVKKDGKVDNINSSENSFAETDEKEKKYTDKIFQRIKSTDEGTKKIIVEQAKYISEEYRETVLQVIEEASIDKGSGIFLPTEKELHIPTDDYSTGKEKNGIHAKGEIFAHEVGHAIDWMLSQPFDPKKAIDKIEKDHPKMGMSSKLKLFSEMEANHCASNSEILSNGKTLNETIIEECRGVDWKQIQRDCGEEVKRYWKEEGIDYDSVVQEYQEETKKLDEKKKEAYNQIDKNIKNLYERIEARNAVREILEKNVKYQRAKELFDKVRDTNKNGVSKYWAPVADIYDGYINGFSFTTTENFLPNCGHDSTPGYWKTYGARGTEFFAEAHAAMVSVPKQKEIIKKYFPKSWSAFEELYKKLRR